MGRQTAYNSAPHQYDRELSDDPARSIGPAPDCPLSPCSSITGAVWSSSDPWLAAASAAPIERTSAPEKGSSTGIRTIERKPKMRCSNLYVHDGTWQVGICAKTAERRGRLVIPVAGLASSPVLSVL